MAAQHATSITFDEYLMRTARIATAARDDKDRAANLSGNLAKVADALQAMAADLAGDHNIAPAVTGQIRALAEAAGRMKRQAARCAGESGNAAEAARLAADAVARVYGQDMQAVDEAGLSSASAAAHHD
jgi:hypothetical protein